MSGRVLLAAPFAALAQQPGKVYRIGVLAAVTNSESEHRLDVFQRALRQLGWTGERAVTFEERSADGHYDRLPRLAAELAALKVDLILAIGGTPAIQAAIAATQTIPIVFPTVGDPVAQKIVQSIGRPGGNATGLTLMSELGSKRMALLKEALPGIKHVALLTNGANPYSAGALPSYQTSSRSLGIQLQVFDARAPEDFDNVFNAMSASGIQAVVVVQDATLQLNMKRLGELALKYRLPLATGNAESGVLVAYEANVDKNYRRAAAYVDKILRGAKPGNLPIEQPTDYVLIINLATAKALGLKIPQSLLMRADEVTQ